MENISFTAFDFETADKLYACQLGIVVVKEGEIVEEKSFLIQPPNNHYSSFTIKVHGITPEQTKNSPTFGELWPSIKHYFEHQVIVFHGSSNDYDLLVLDTEFERHGIEAKMPLAARNTFNLFDDITKSKSLDYLCRVYDIDMDCHHDALSDARCCAKLFIKCLTNANGNWDLPIEKREKKNQVPKLSYTDPNRNLSSDVKVQDLGIVENPNTIFYDKKVVISGIFERYPKRNDLAQLLKGYGADINGSVSSKTNIFIVGSDSGPKKMEKVFELNESGYNIQIIEEKQLYTILDKIENG